jgi:NHLM bacteriocin system ABC transporter ATP-binding protein
MAERGTQSAPSPRRSADASRLAANHTLLLDGPAQAWIVEEGDVLVFATETSGEQATGERHLLGLFGPGDVLLGSAQGARSRLALLATGVGEAWVRRMPLHHLCERDDAAAGIERWVSAIWQRLAHDRYVPSGLRVLPGDGTTRAAGSEALHPDAGVTWVAAHGGAFTLAGADTAIIEDGAGPVPVSTDGWVVALADLELTSVSTQAVLAAGDAPRCLGLFMAAIMAALATDFDQLLAHRAETARRGAARSDAASDAALLGLAAVLPGTGSAARRAPADDPLLAAFTAVAASLGIGVDSADPALRAAAARGGPREQVSAFAAIANCRVRSMSLPPRWWDADSGPLLCQAADGRPLAVTRAWHGYQAYDPAHGTSWKVDQERAEQIAGSAFVLYRGLRAETRGLTDLLRTGLRHSGIDLGRVVLFGSFTGIASLVTPILTSVIFNEVVPQNQRGRLLAAVLTLIVVALSVGIASVTRGVAFIRVAARFEGASQVAVWDRLLRMPVGFYNRYLVGDLTNRTQSLESVQNLLSDSTVAIVLNGVFSLFNIALFAAAGTDLFLVGVGLVLIELGAIWALCVVEVRLSRRQLATQNRTQGLTLQLLRGIYKLRVAAAESRAFAVWARVFTDQRRVTYRAGRVLAGIAVFMTVWTTIGTLAIVAVVAVNGLGSVTLGSYMEFTVAFGQVSGALSIIVSSLSMLVVAVPLLEQVRPVLEGPVEIGSGRDAPGVLTGAVDISGVSFRYFPEAPVVLDGVSFSAAPGEFVALVGPSGAGKSSLVRLLLGFESVEAGTVRYDGRDLAKLDVAAVRRQIGTVIQTARLLPGTIFSNIAGSASITREQAWAAAEAAGVADDIKAMPMGLETVIVEGAATISGGQAQRLLIARALALRPRILIFDEATSALDNVTQAIVTASLARLQVTRIVIAHRLSTIQHADRVYVLVKGQVAQVGTFAELSAAAGPFADLARRQLV